jgi:hypothetical protein
MPDEVALWVEELNRVLDETLQALRNGERNRATASIVLGSLE